MQRSIARMEDLHLIERALNGAIVTVDAECMAAVAEARAQMMRRER